MPLNMIDLQKLYMVYQVQSMVFQEKKPESHENLGVLCGPY